MMPGSARHVRRLLAGLMFLSMAASGVLCAPDDLVIYIQDYPLDPGTRWTYATAHSRPGVGPGSMIVQICERKLDRPDFVEIVSYVEGAGFDRGYIQVLPDAMALYAGLDDDKPVYRLSFPVEVGVVSRFESPSKGSAFGAGTVTVRAAARETVTVPLGTYDCLRVEIEPADPGAGAKATKWITPGVGVVKQIITNRAWEFTLELTGFQRDSGDLVSEMSVPTFEADFDSPSLDDWQVRSGEWQVSEGALRSSGQGNEIVFIKKALWEDCRISFRLRVVSGIADFFVGFRAIRGQRGMSYLQIDGGSLKLRHGAMGDWRDISEHVPAPAVGQ